MLGPAYPFPEQTPNKGIGLRVRTPWRRLGQRPFAAPPRRSAHEAPALPPCRSLVIFECSGITSDKRTEIARTRDAVPPLRSSMEDRMGYVNGGHEVFALFNQPR